MKKAIAACFIILFACGKQENKQTIVTQPTDSMTYTKGSFGYDLDFLKQHHKDLVLLHDDSSKAQLIVLPSYQGRVMTSTSGGNSGSSFGWINYDLVSAPKAGLHISAFGGEERFWLGPEGGQFSIYFKKGVDFTFDNWFVPKEIDTEAFTLTGSSSTEAKFEKKMHLENYSGNTFDLVVNRNIRLLDRTAIDSLLGLPLPPWMETVGFESENIITNTGKTAWTKKTGMLSIWILSMLNASEKTTVAIPFKQGDEKQLGKIVTDDYFGKVPVDRLKVTDKLILFKADSKHRSKIGLSPERATPVAASYNATDGVLTIAMFSLPEGANEFVNSLWQIQKEPFKGDAINSYNDGPVNNQQMGQVYEIESSSPAAALKPTESLSHFHRTIHLKGPKEELDKISQKLLGVNVDEITL